MASAFRTGFQFELNKEELLRSLEVLMEISQQIDQGIWDSSLGQGQSTPILGKISPEVVETFASSSHSLLGSPPLAPASSHAPLNGPSSLPHQPPALTPSAPAPIRHHPFPPPPCIPLDSTSPSLHQNGAIATMTFLPPSAIPLSPQGLQGQQHGGWLLSASDKTINLWACAAATTAPSSSSSAAPAAAASFQPSLHLSTSKSVPFRTISMEYLPRLGRLAAITVEPLHQQKIGLYSLSPESFLTELSFHGLPQAPSQVVQVPGFSAERVACSILKEVILLDTTPTGFQEAARWTAHKVAISTLRQPRFIERGLITGDAKGNVHVWDVSRQATPSTVLFEAHTQAISSAEMTGPNILVTMGADGTCKIWDLRNPAAPLDTKILDGTTILSSRVSPQANTMAISTLAGLHEVAFSPSDPLEWSPLTLSKDREHVRKVLVWNDIVASHPLARYDSLLYSADLSGSISTFGRKRA